MNILTWIIIILLLIDISFMTVEQGKYINLKKENERLDKLINLKKGIINVLDNKGER